MPEPQKTKRPPTSTKHPTSMRLTDAALYRRERLAAEWACGLTAAVERALEEAAKLRGYA